MISFLQPLALLGLAAAAIPPLLHLIGRKHPPLFPFPAVRYLSETERKHSKRLKLRNLLLLLMRTAIIALIAMAAARPVARLGFGTTHAPMAVAVVIDNSLSSGAVTGGRRVLDLLIEQGRHVLDRAGDSDHLWIVLADGVPRRLSVPDARGLLDTLPALPVRLDISQAVRAAIGAMAGDVLLEREVVVLTDLQTTALSPGPPVDARVLLWAPQSLPENRGLDSARAVPPVWSPTGEVVAAIGGTSSTPAAIRLAVGGRDVARSFGGSGDRVVLAAAPNRTGWFASSVTLDPDELRADDVRHLAVFVAPPAAATALPGAGRFVSDALAVLQQAGRARSGNDVTLTDRPVQGTAIIFPPADPALVGSVNRTLSAVGSSWRFGELLDGEWELSGSLETVGGTPVFRRRRLDGSGNVLESVGSEPWLVRDGDLVIVASRMEEEWTSLPVTAAFVPFLDQLLNRVAGSEAWMVNAAPGEVVAMLSVVSEVLTDGGSIVVPSSGRISAPLERGVYFLRGAGTDTVGALEVNHDRRESILERAIGRVVRATLGRGAMVLDARGLDRELFRGARRADLTSALLLAALAMAVVELALGTAGGSAAGDA